MDNTLQTTDPISPEALNSVRLAAVMKALQKQRESLSNEVVNLTAEVEQVEFKFKREQNMVRQQQAELAEQRKAVELLNMTNDELTARVKDQDVELEKLRQLAASNEAELRLLRGETSISEEASAPPVPEQEQEEYAPPLADVAR